jgi:hypothetical protein
LCGPANNHDLTPHTHTHPPHTTEYNDLSATLPDVVAQLRARLATYRAVEPLKGEGCWPTIITIPASHGGEAFAFQPCDAPKLQQGA